MRYRLFIYASTAATASTPAISTCNYAVSTDSMYQWEYIGAARFMKSFNTEAITAEIVSAVGDRCKVEKRLPPPSCGNIAYLCVYTSYDQIPFVLPRIHAITAENDLVLYDVETDKVFFRELVDRTHITFKTRRSMYLNAILSEMQPVWHIRKIAEYSDGRDYSCTYNVTVRKDSQKNFLDRCREFYLCLSRHLADNETLKTENECFTIVGKWYSIVFCLEGYKKQSDKMGFYSNGRPEVKLIHRMGCEEGFRWIKRNPKSKNTILSRMNLYEMERAYPNHADRFVASVKISKWEQKQVFDISYHKH